MKSLSLAQKSSIVFIVSIGCLQLCSSQPAAYQGFQQIGYQPQAGKNPQQPQPQQQQFAAAPYARQPPQQLGGQQPQRQQQLPLGETNTADGNINNMSPEQLQQLAQSLTPYLREVIDKEAEEIAEALDNHLLDSGFAAGLSTGEKLAPLSSIILLTLPLTTYFVFIFMKHC